MVERTSQLAEIINRYREQLEKSGIHVERMLLFGSYADDTAHEDSDIDLFVISRDWAKYNQRERLEMLGVAAGRILEPIEAIGFTPEEIEKNQISSFWEMVLKEQAVAV